MSGETKLFNIPANTLRPGPTLTVVVGPEGKTTATMDFTCRKFDIGKQIIQAQLAKGTRLISLYPQAGTEFTHLRLDNWTSRDEPGGITTVTCNFSGVDTTTEGGSETSVVYTRNNSLRELPIWQNPKLIEELTTLTILAIKEVIGGTAYYVPDTGEIKRTGSDLLIATVSEPAELSWVDYILTQGQETYLAATSEWTKSATGRGSLTGTTLNKFGKIDSSVPGNPHAPTGEDWLMTGATESIQVTGDGANSYSLTWTSGVWPTRIYGT